VDENPVKQYKNLTKEDSEGSEAEE